MDRFDPPVETTSTFLLDLGWIHANGAMFGKVAREVIFSRSSTLSEAAVVTIVSLLGASH